MSKPAAARTRGEKKLTAPQDVIEPTPHVRVLLGTEPLLLQEAKTALVGDSFNDFNRDRFELCDHSSIAACLAAAQQCPVMASKRLVEARGLEDLPAKDHPPLIAYLSRPVPTTFLVITGKSLAKTTRLYRALQQAHAIVQTTIPHTRAIPDWLITRARGQKVKIDAQAARLLVDLSGTELGLLAVQLDQLALFVGPRQSIDTNAVTELIAQSKIASIFALTHAVSKNDWGQATLSLHRLLQNGQGHLAILAMIARQLRMLLTAKQWQGPTDELGKVLNVPEFVARELLHDSQNFLPQMLERGLVWAAQCDQTLKTVSVPPSLVLDGLLAKMLRTA